MRITLSSACLLVVVSTAIFADEPLQDDASQSLKKAVGYFREHVASGGGYLWMYSADLSKREGEGVADDQTVWIQPPGTPSVGLVYLDAYDATGDKFYLETALEVGDCLVRGQLRSGGWDYRISFDPKQRKKYSYRVDPPTENARNTTTLDDNNTQAALRFMMRLDQTLGFKNKRIHEATEFALSSLLKAQYPNGAWPQRYDRFPNPEDHPVLKANYPATFSRTHPKKDYRNYYTFNDNAIADVVDVMFIAERTYNDKKYRQAAERAGGFILLAQMPEPQPAWAQQYNLRMQPAWARRFEPASITGGESQGVMRTLLRLYRDTGDKKYLAPLPRAIEYLRKSQIDGGGLARFYELRTNRPLYFTKQYVLTYDDGDLPTHYGFKVGNGLDSIEREYKRLSQLPADQLGPPRASKPKLSKSLENQVRSVLAALDSKGRWLEDGKLKAHREEHSSQIISCRTFIKNAAVLSRYLSASR